MQRLEVSGAVRAPIVVVRRQKVKMAHGNNAVNDIQVHQTPAVQSAQYDTYQHQNRTSGHTNGSNCYKLNSIGG